MKVLNYFSALLLIAFATACGNAAEQGYTADPVKPTVTDTSKTKQVIQPPTTAPAITETVALNPAHGQPGHRCELAVGAPLNSTPAPLGLNTNQTQQIQTTVNPTPPLTSAPVTTGSGKKNPAHGQPGHRCDLAVGAPLN